MLLFCAAAGFTPSVYAQHIPLKDTLAPKEDSLLHHSKKNLREVIVTARSAAQAAFQQPQAIAVIDARKYYNRPEGAIDIINQTTGVKVRQDGGLGSNADFYVNGLSGKAIKFFIDGIPLDFLGSGLNLNILPLNIIDRIEIYKGVVPVKLGADALGGAIDVITRKSITNYIDASYAISSFNTHRASLNSRQRINSLLYINATGFYNYSDNNYKIDVTIPNDLGNPEPATIRRFHDQFNSYFASVETGLLPQRWLDKLSFTTALSGSHQQIQNNLTMSQPYAHVQYGEHSWNNALQFAKANLWQKLSMDGYVAVNHIRSHFLDTSLYTYDWNGKPVARRTTSGETFGSRQDLRVATTNTLARINLHYYLDSNTHITAGVTEGNCNRKEEDPKTAAFPTGLQKFISGLSLEKQWFHHKLTSVTSVKYYLYSAKGYTINASNSFTAERMHQKQAGWNQSLKWQWNANLLIKASYEYATRLPDDDELFGDYALVRPNPALIPERSHNLTTGLQYSHQRWKAELNGFYRKANNLVYLRTSQFYAQYQNLLQAQITGIEAETSYKLFTALQLRINATWQNIINKSSAANSGTTDNRYYNLRLPNIPFLFSNGELTYSQPAVFSKGDHLSAWYNTSYVHWFYLYWSVDGRADQKATIPTQFIQNTGVSYAIKDNRYAISVEVQNLADAKVYDNFNVQRPGRSFHLKLKTFIQ